MDGKKTVAQQVFYGALDESEEEDAGPGSDRGLHQAVENVKPHIEVRSKRVGGAAYQVPMQVSKRGSNRWRFAGSWGPSARRRAARPPEAGRRIVWRPTSKEGAAMTKRENMHRMADANKAFAHFAW